MACRWACGLGRQAVSCSSFIVTTMQNYYRLLGVPTTAPPDAIRKAYQQQLLRLRQRRPDRNTPQRLDALQAAHDILLDEPRRWAYNQLLAQEPVPPHPAAAYAGIARGINQALLALALLLCLDWAWPPRQFTNEPVLIRKPIMMMASSPWRPEICFDITTPHGWFRLYTAQAHRVRANATGALWCSAVLGIVRRVQAPGAPMGDTSFQPDSGSLYRLPFIVLLPLLALLAGLGLWPGRGPLRELNMAIAGVILLVLVAAVGWFY